MDRIPFDPYDFFGYLASGLLVLLGMDLVFGFPHILGRDFKVVETVVLLLAVYIAGQMIATPAKAFLEDGVVDKILDRPNVNLFRLKRPWLRGLMFPGFYKPLPAKIRERILAKAETAGIRDTGEALFLHVRYDPQILGDEKLMSKLGSFLNKYGFARNLAFTCLLVGVGLLTKARLSSDIQLLHYAYTGLAAALLLFYRYLKFFRQYSYELFNVYAGMK
jgi:hypothetical protein